MQGRQAVHRQGTIGTQRLENPEPPACRRMARRRLGWLLALALLLMIGGGGGAPAGAGAPLAALSGGASLAPMLETVTPAVVNISVRTRTAQSADNPLLNDPFFRRFFNVPEMPRERERVSVSAGSGVIIDAGGGLVITNHHVVRNADEIRVVLKDRRQFKAQLVGSDAGTDIALLRIPAERLTALGLGDSERLKVGDAVVAIGNPFGLGQTVTSGIISALGRTGLNLEGYEDFIQTDASINPGNSGGALVNFQGELIGINTAIIGPAGGNVGIGFAVPVNMVKAVVAQLEEHGTIRRGRLGVAIQDLTPDLAESLGLPTLEGAMIAKVEPDSSAERAGLRKGDVVTAIDGHPVRGSADLRNRVGLARVGDTLRIDYLRGREARLANARVNGPVAGR